MRARAGVQSLASLLLKTSAKTSSPRRSPTLAAVLGGQSGSGGPAGAKVCPNEGTSVMLAELLTGPVGAKGPVGVTNQPARTT
eukprot:7396156-Pyramimonas_sp.AAC.1